ncbi:amino acid adenylation domain-containing protein [Paucimonas lemoignei]|uniref:Amino acid adenylation domain-containing protein n=1 Tax=Paucimonas lemoignei TaxID=29443 RepID=A0A4R3I604_PAULE|nr:non-ribosomal peptide synthase/polyketide synthase [Paucimonas lemoignei]TCS39449.1 amino acid adenylation domain-containing protein [Paucimonas lemoignei]
MHPVAPEEIKTFVDLLSYRAREKGDALAFRFLSYSATGIEEKTITFAELDARARRIAEHLLQICRPGDRALMLYPSGLEFIEAYFGCLYAGVIAVPGYPPKRNQKLGRLKSLVQNCQARVALTDSQTQAIAEPQFAEVAELSSLDWLITDKIDAVAPLADKTSLPQIGTDDIAFLQYTSGSTGDPKGVMVSHGNLMANSRSIYTAMGHGPETVVVGWLPLFHDMGLIGNVLQPVYAGIPATLMAPASFLQHPLRWLEAISTYRATTSGGPNFAYDLCVGSVKDDELAQLDLRSWNVAFNGAEPIRPESQRAFSKRFGACGFDPSAHYACYGMAETTLLITGIEPGQGARTSSFDREELQKNRVVPLAGTPEESHELASCGYSRCEQGVLIVNPETLTRCADREVGEIWAYGDSNAKGYWQKPDATAATFAARLADTGEGPYLRTGDLGFVHDGELFIAGRLKDVVIIRGMNHYPQDIELTAFESHEAFMPNGAAVFTIVEDGEEQLVVVLEVRRTHLRSMDPDLLARAIQQAVVMQHELQVHNILFIKPGQLPKTSSGKVQRQACKKLFLAGEIDAIARIDKSDEPAEGELPSFDRSSWDSLEPQERLVRVENYLAAVFEAFAQLPAGSIRRDVPVLGYGLDSLALTRLAAHVAEDTDVALQVQHLFEHETVSALAGFLNDALSNVSASGQRQRIVPMAREGVTSQNLPLSYAQQRMWFLMQYEASSLYNIAGVLGIRGELNVAALDMAFREIFRRHVALRTRFVMHGDQAVQVVDEASDWKLSVMDLSDRNQAEIDDAIARDLHYVFDLSQDILFRANLYKQPDGSHALVVCMHHIISDGWSVAVLMRELSALYAAFDSGKASPLAALPVQYADYAAWQQQYLQGDVLSRQEAYWKGQLQGVMPLNLPTDRVRPARPGHAGNTIALQIDSELTGALKSVAREQGATLYMTLLAAFGTLLHKYSGQDDFCIGSPIANRNHPEIRELIGFFVNTLALRANYGGDPEFGALLKSVRKTTVDAYAHQDLPFEKVVDLVTPERDLSTSPLFQVMFVLQDAAQGNLSLNGLEVSRHATVSGTSKFDLTLELQETSEGLSGHIEYKTELFDEATILRLAAHFRRLLVAIVRAPAARLSQLPLLDVDERHTLLELWNDTEKTFRQPERLHHLFSRQLAKTPDAPAVVAGNERLTFADLEVQANRLAHCLIARGVSANSIVGLCVERSLDMVVGMLAILKAGGAYLPLDPNYPAERLRYMLEQSRAAVLVTRPVLENIFAGMEVPAILLDPAQPLASYIWPGTDPKVETDCDDLAYVIYTSGSTGRPKGVPISHAAICNQMGWVLNQFPMQADDRMLQKTPFSFDASVWEIWAPLISGAQLVLAAPDGHQDVDYLVETIVNEKITQLQAVPALLRAMLAAPAIGKVTSLRRIFLGGEALPVDLARQAQRLAGKVINLYGPTECSINASWFDMGNLPARAQGYVPIGRPVSNLQFYVLDAQLQPVPMGVAGELHIAGAGLSPGYLHQPELTAQRFVDNPFNTHDSPKLYKTGDLVRYLPGGQLEFIARIDEQIKIRGQRIELGEIEKVLAEQTGVVESAVAVKGGDGMQRLVAYVVAADANLSHDDLRARLAQALPEYMVPSIFVSLPALPRNNSGKVDRKALPEPVKPNFTEYQALATPTEKSLAAIWSKLLDGAEVHGKSNFFHIGGHSLLAARMVARIREQWRIAFAIRNVFEAQELHALAALIDLAAGIERSEVACIPHVQRGGPLALSHAQQRMWVVNQLDEHSAQYNMPAAIDLEGKIDEAALERAFDAFIARHEILRTVYRAQDGVPYQEIREQVDFQLAKVDLSSLAGAAQDEAREDAVRNEALRQFDLSSDLMLRATLVRLSVSRHTLLVTMHHIASDGWSSAILVKELSELYGAFTEGRTAELPALPIQYADYAAWQTQTLSGTRLEALRSYWRTQLAQLPSVHNLPLDRARPALPSYRGAAVEQMLPHELTARLKRLANEQGTTLFTVLHAAFASLLHRFSGESDIVVGTPVANRELSELEPLVGLFVNTLVLRSDLSENPDFIGLLQQSMATFTDAYEHQDLPFEMLVNELQVERSQSFNQLFQVMLVFQSGGENRLELPNLTSSGIRETAGLTKFDLTLNVVESDRGLKLSWEYATDLFEESSIQRMAESFGVLLNAVAAQPQQSVKQLPLVSEHERASLMGHANALANDAFPPACSHLLFEAQAERMPQAAALRFGDEEVSYAELNRRANKLAHYLVGLGVRPDTLVGLCVDRSPDMVVGLLAILKAGGAYVPFDPSYPADRLRYMLEDCGAKTVLIQSALADLLPVSGQRLVIMDDDQITNGLPENNIDPDKIGLMPQSLAYVIYTSGSTGNPKASLLMHQGLSNLAQAQAEFFHVEPESRLLQFASFAFDAATSEIFMALCAGATLHIVPRELVQSGPELSDYVAGNGITHATLPPALLPVLERDKWQSIRHLTVAGEHCPIGLVREWAQGRAFYNAYGPSETSVCSSMALLTPDTDVVHMGRPMRGVQLHVLDDAMQPVPHGVAGQLFVGGRGVGRGYLGRDELNSEKFVDNPFGDGKLYATGDLVRLRADGNLEFIGRMDSQVKIRGFRIELGEIEASLARQPGVADVAVVVHKDKDQQPRLVAYIVAADAAATPESLRASLAASMPNYMVPSAFVLMECFPMTPNGKVDRKRLPEPDVASLVQTEFVAPRNASEEALAAIWSGLLGLDSIGVHHNFFDLGGNSLLAIQAISRIKEQFGVQMKVADLFVYTSIASLARRLEELAADDCSKTSMPLVTPRAGGDILPLSLEQQSYWFLYELEGGSATYNIPAAIRLNGRLDIGALERSFAELIARHESLRTVLVVENGQPSQQVMASPEFVLHVDERKENRYKEVLDRQIELDARYVLDLRKEIPIRAVLHKIFEDDHVLTILLHHTMADGWSLDILIRDLSEIYNAIVAGQSNPLSPLPVQYGDYALWQKNVLEGEHFEKQVVYWRDTLKGVPPMLDLPTDFPRPPVQSYRGQEVAFALPFELTRALNEFARKNKTTLFNTLMAGLNVLLSRYSRNDDIAIGTAIANRSQTDLEPLIGCFANTLVIRNRVEQELSFVELVKRVNGAVFAAYEHAGVPFDVVVDAVQPERSLGVPPIFQVMFRLHNQRSGEGIGFAGMKVERIAIASDSAKLDLNFSLVETESGLEGVIEYATDLFTEKTIRRIARHFQLLLESAMVDSQAPIESLNLLSREEFDLVEQWNDTDAPYPQDECMYQLFETSAAHAPDNLAYVCGDVRLTYAELNERANRLAHYLRTLGVGPEVKVGVSVGRTAWAAICMLAVFKSGGTYVPLDPKYPKERIDVMLDVVKPQFILSVPEIAGLFAGVAAKLVLVDQIERELAAQPTHNPAAIGADHAAYILFTSGTTGRPKAILVGHRAFRNMAESHRWAKLHGAGNRVLQFASLSFSISMWDSFMAWVPGATLIAANDEQAMPGEALYELLQREQVTHATWPVSLLSTLPVERIPASLQTIISSAEPCNDAVVARWTARGVRFLNMYGNSEVSLGSTLYEYHKVGQKLTIGVAFPNTRMYLLDKHLRQVPVGVIAEIHTAGAGLATCYFDNPEATAKSFICNPFSRDENGRLYKTGDLGRYLPNGEIEYIGREDFQVSIRGFRVELAEIESVLREAAGIAEVVVVSQQDASQVARLVCFYVERADASSASAAQLRELVAAKLPSYMVPSLFVRLDAMPLTPNRKVDRLALAKMSIDDSQDLSFVAPRSDLERALAAIWSEVLGLQEIGITRNFFEIGGHSLLAVQVVARIKDGLGLPMSIKDLFTHNTIESLANYLSGLDSQGEAGLPPITPREGSGLIPLSLDQKPYWFLHQLEGGSHTYNIPFAMRLFGTLDVKALEQSLRSLIERHESLRTLFPVKDGEPAQQVVASPDVRLAVLALSAAEVEQAVRADFLHVFDLARELPIRARLLQVDDGSHVVTLVVHHVVADGWSLNVLVRELTELYTAFSSGAGNPLPELALQYGDYSEWQHRKVIGAVYDRQTAFWKDKLAGLAPLLNLPLDYPRPPLQSYRGRELAIALPFALSARLNQYARQHNTTLYNLLLAGLAILLSRYGRTDDVPVGTAVANRPQRELEDMIGCFANTLVIRCRVNPKQSFQQLVANVGEEALEAFSNGSVPFDGVVEAVQPERSLGVPPIFQVMFRLHNQQMAQTSSFAGLRSELLNIPTQSAKLDLNFSLAESADGIGGVIEYATDIFSEQTVARIARHYQTVLAAALSDATTPIEHLSVVTAEEMEQVRQWNATTIAYPQDECMHHLFERAVERAPNKLAYVCGDDRFSYAELNARANRLAHFLQSRGVGPEVRIGVSVERSTWAGIGCLAAFKSGGTYVPLDVNYPKDRIARMLEVARPKIILTLSSIAPLFAGCDAEVICLDTDRESIQSQPIFNPPRIGADHSAYILFTSGTTGKPKGILVGHRAFRNMAVSHEWAGLLTPDCRVLQFASLSFSIALWGAFMAWVPGGTLYSVTPKQALPDEPLYDLLEENQITHATWPVSLLSTMPVERMPSSLKTVISSAEPCNDAVVEKWTRAGVRFLNMYGNSEVSIGSTLYEYKQIGEKLTIGKPFPNTQMYLLDESLKQVPIGVIAEIHTAGVGLATGYVDDPVATARSFIPNPFSDMPGSRMYKTGDLGRYLPNGEIEFIGREDFQVSIRGFRVELTEIEDVLRAIPGVLEAVVTSRDDQQGLARLVCFYTLNEAAEIGAAELRKVVGDRLPNYMVPSLFVRLDAMPLTPNRKIDRLALCSYPIEENEDGRHVAPRNAVERRLAAIWEDILGMRELGVRHNFFELGGHSLLATKTVSRIRAEFGVELSLQQFFEHATIEGLAELVTRANAACADRPIRVLEKRDLVPLSYAQQRLWFLDRYEENSNFYHMPSLLKVSGRLDAAALEKAFLALIERHEVLRTNFIAQDGRGMQQIHAAIDWSMDVVELDGATTEEKESQLAGHIGRQLQTGFKLDSDVLLRAVLFRLADDEHRLFINMHHIISDGWSITVLIREVSALYAAIVQGEKPALSPLPVQYADFSVWQIEHLQGALLANQGGYWTEKLKDQATLSLPLDFDRPKNQTYNGDRLKFAIDADLRASLEDLSKRHGATLFMTLLTAFNVMLSRYSGDTDISIGTPVANRVRAEIEPLIGFFANTLVLRSDLEGNPEFTALLEQVRQTTLEAYSHQDIPFEKVVDLVLPERDPSRSPLFQVSFSLQNMAEGKFNLPGIEISNVALENKTSKFDLLLEILDNENGMDASFEFNTDLFRPESILGYVAAYLHLLRAIAENPQQRLASLPLAVESAPRSSLAWADYPLLKALHVAQAVGNETVAYSLTDSEGRAVPMGAIGQLHLHVVDGESPAATGFTARETSRGLVLLSTPDDVALIDGQLVYPRAVEQCLLQMPGMQDCHIMVRTHPGKGHQLVAYMVCDGEMPDEEASNAYLTEGGMHGVSLLACVKVPAIPLTRHGAINARQLQKLAVHNQATLKNWAQEVASNTKVRQAILLEQAAEDAQSVSHLFDLLPPEARGMTAATTPQVRKAKKGDNRPVSDVPAVIISDAIIGTPHQPAVLADMLIHTAMSHPDRGISFYYADNSTAELSYPELLHRAQCVLSGLRGTGIAAGDKVIFQFARSEDFIAAFWACALGGFIPVPIAAAKNYRSSNAQTLKIAHAWRMMDKAIVLAGDTIVEGVRNIGTLEGIADFTVHAIGAMYDEEPAREFHRGSSDDVALIMLTSGSTGMPKGVQLSHANLIGRSMGSVQMNGFHAGMPSLNWMALDHVGGIIYFHIRDIHTGATQVQADTDYILADPLRWLQLIDRHRINITWAPNFAFSLIVDRQDQLKQGRFDLSCLKFMLNGAEAVVPKTTQTFIELLQAYGLGDDCVKPVYGMSEISSGVTYSSRLKLTYGSDDTVFVSVGKPIPGVNMRIVDGNDQPMMEGQSGRLQVSGVTVTHGYLGGEAINRDAFTADGWFKTGDLAFIEGGELTITGREKDIIIINGVNFYSHEIAEVVEAVPGVTVSYTAACAVRRDGSNSDQLAIFFHSVKKGGELSELIRQIRQAVMEKIGVNPSYIVPLEKDQVPKTEIGKIQLSQLAGAFNRGEFDHALRALDIAERNDNTLPDWFFSKAWVKKQLGNVLALPGNGVTLVFADRSGIAERLHLSGQVVTVSAGQGFQENGDSFRINPALSEHYVQMLKSLAGRSLTIERVISLWDCDSSSSGKDALMSRAPLADSIGLYSAWYLAQALASQQNAMPMRWIWVGRGAQRVAVDETLNPDKASALALLKTLSKEFPWLHCRHVDLAAATDETDLAMQAAQVAKEAGAIHADEEVAYRAGRRYVSRLRRQDLAKDSGNDKGGMQLQTGGAYLISGGLGGIAFALARTMLRQFGARLLLVGRTPQTELSAEKLDMLEDLQRLGSVSYVGADTCDYRAIEKAVDEAEAGWQQKLAGVFHLAGLAREEAMATQTIHSLHDTLRPKTLGTRVLYRICEQRGNALFVNFSSVNAHFGGSGMAAYNIANRYQEAFVEAVSNNAAVRSVSISWSLWHDTGMGRQYREAEGLSRSLGFTPIKVAQGMNSLLAALWHGCGNVLIGLDDTRPNVQRHVDCVRLRQRPILCYFTGNEPDLAREVAAGSVPRDEFGNPVEVSYHQMEALPLKEDGNVDTAALRRNMVAAGPARAEKVAPRDEIETTLTRIASEVFGITEPIGVRDNFFDVGANSLLIVKLHHEIQEQLNVQFPMVELFNSTTVEKLAAFIGQQSGQGGDGPAGNSAADAARAAGQERRAAMQRRNRSRERKVAR